MSARSFLGVILSDERSEESKEPFGRPAIGVLRLRARPTRKRGVSEILCGRYAQDDTSIRVQRRVSDVSGAIVVATELLRTKALRLY
jgi:hypothetical protein